MRIHTLILFLSNVRKVIEMSDLGFSPINDKLYVKGVYNNVNANSLQYEGLDQEYKKWHYFSSTKSNTTAYSFSSPKEAAYGRVDQTLCHVFIGASQILHRYSQPHVFK